MVYGSIGGGGVAPPVREKLYASLFRSSFEKNFYECEHFSIFHNMIKKFRKIIV